MVLPPSCRVSRVPQYSGYRRDQLHCHTRLSLSMAGFPKTILTTHSLRYAVHTPTCTHVGLGSFHFARRYFGNRFFFLFLRVLRCFSSPGSPRIPMNSIYAPWLFTMGVPPFGHPRINAYLRLPAAFRSLSRPSSAPNAKAFSICSSSLELPLYFRLRSY